MVRQMIDTHELHLLKKEIESLGESQVSESLERRSAVDLLRMELEATRRTLENIFPDFAMQYKKVYDEIVHAYDPELGRQIIKKRTGTTS